jgi:DNA-binding response OmpR family regulator
MERVLVLDDDRDLLESFVDLLHAFDRDCLPARTVGELRAHAAEALDCELAILDINLGKGEPSGIDAYRWLREQRFGGRIVFLTGHGQAHPLVVAARQLGDVEVLSKPLSAAQLRALVAA